jgi:hypothetical protein
VNQNDALNTLNSILQSAAAGPQQFAPNSRYYGLPTTTLTTRDGTVVAYLTRRFVPPPENFALVSQHAIVQGDRLDNLAARYFNDPVQFWRLCDANRALRPDELIETLGRMLAITLPDGVPLGTGKI